MGRKGEEDKQVKGGRSKHHIKEQLGYKTHRRNMEDARRGFILQKMKQPR